MSAGADLTNRPVLRRAGRLTATAALSASFVALVHDLGRPSRFINMLRVVKVTSPMSVGTWILTGYAPFVYAAGAHELIEITGLATRLPRPVSRLLGWSARPAGLAAAAIAPAVAAYTGVLLADTATPSWNSARRELPFLFASSAAAAAAGMGMLCAPIGEAGPARRLAVGASMAELAIEHQMESSMGLSAEPLHQGRAGRLMRAARALTTIGGVGALGARRSRVVAAVSGAALASRLGLHPIRHLRGRPGVSARSEVHGGPAARADGCAEPAGRLRPVDSAMFFALGTKNFAGSARFPRDLGMSDP